MSVASVENGRRERYRGGSRTLVAQRKKKAAFLEAYVRCGVVSEAARAAGVERTTHYWWLRAEEEKKKREKKKREKREEAAQFGY